MREQLEAKEMRAIKAGMRIQIRLDPLIIGRNRIRYFFHWIRIRVLPVTRDL